MKKHAKLTLEKERLGLKIKQQEYEIKKTMLDLKEIYHPLNLALNLASEMISGQNTLLSAAAPTSESGDATDSFSKNGKRPELSAFSNFLAQIIGLLQNYLQLASDVADRKQNIANTKTEYIIGKDDV